MDVDFACAAKVIPVLQRPGPADRDGPGGFGSQCQPSWGQTAQQQRVAVLLGLLITDDSV